MILPTDTSNTEQGAQGHNVPLRSPAAGGGFAMSRAPAAGERAALRGFRWQYDHIAALVYDALLDGELVTLRLTDPDAGRVDDLVLVRRRRTDSYQFKSVEFNSYLTFNQVVRDQRTHGGNKAPSLVRSLADGWERLRSRGDSAHVHLVTEQLASVNDHLSDGDGPDKPSPDHFSAFLTKVLEPLRSSETALDDIGAGWEPALTRLHQASGVAREQLGWFLQSLHFDVGAGSGLPASPSTRNSDIVALSAALCRRVSEASDVVELDKRGVLELMGWSDRALLHSLHEFPVDLDTYAPLAGAIADLNESIGRHDSGYVAVIGPPGSGKSTLLSQALTGSPDRIIRYYAFVPGTALARTRLTARGFLHDVVFMLNESGIESSERQLTGSDVHELRQQLAEQFDAASGDFARTRRRTIVVVDGLDHVDRDYSGDDGLLDELPCLSELPNGILFIVGSRTLAPLRADAREQVEERRATVDLEQHRLSPASVLEICRHAPVTAGLAPEVHQRVAELSNGHPLALSYLLNRLRDADGESAEDILGAAPAYEGDVAAEYRAVWDELEDDDDIVEILAVCSRLRIGFTTDWLASWAPRSAVRTFRRKLLYLFRRHHDGWRFFHDSFRQFAADRTALGDDARPDKGADVQAHQSVAELCAGTDDPRIAAEQLYHRHQARQDDEALVLAQQVTFREQYRRLRSADLIREDVVIALGIAAKHADMRAMVRLLLALIEVSERTTALESVEMPSLLYDTGLIDEAIAYCGAETRRVPLAHAYDLAARLGSAGDPAGRRIFDVIEHDGLDDPKRTQVSGQENEAAVAWVRAAALFRPLPIVIDAVRRLVEDRSENDRDDRYAQDERWDRYERMMETLIDAVALKADESALDMIDSALADHAAQLIEASSQPQGGDDEKGGDDARISNIAMAIGLQVRSHAALLGRATTAEVAEIRLDKLLSTLRDAPLFPSTVLEAAELLARYGMTDPAVKLLDRVPYGKALTVDVLGYGGEPDALDRRFRYWRLRYLLALSDDDVPESIPPATDTPAGDDLARDAPVHSDLDAIELAERIDAAVRALGQLDAANTSGQSMPPSDVWAALVPLLDVFRPSASRSSATLGGIAQKKLALMRIIVAVALRCGQGLPQRLSDAMARRFEEQPERWSRRLRLDLADDLRSAGASVPWYRETLVAQEADAASQDVYSRLDEVADLVRRYARDGEEKTARCLVRSLIPMALGVGFRKDYQCDSWVAWLGRALAEPDGGRLVDEAAWLARVLTAVDPMTEGAPGSAAADVPAAVVPADPMAAVRIFEYLVRHGTVHHLDALAALVRTLVTHAGPGGLATVELAADIAGELIAPAANQAYPDLAAALVTAAEGAAGRTKAMVLAESVASRTDSHALPTARTGWRQGLGVAATAEEHEDNDSARSGDDAYGALVLSDGRRIARDDVGSHVRSVDDIIALRRDEASDSSFSWVHVVDQQTLTSDDVRKLADVFRDGSMRSLDVLVSLARVAERNGDRDTAWRLGSDVFQSAAGDAWSRYYGGARLRAAAITVSLGGQDARVAACQDLARHATSNRWLPGLMISDLQSIVEALDPTLGAATIWPEVRTYLDGIAETCDLVGPHVLADHGCRWWLPEPSGDRRIACDNSTPAAALAELLVGHLSHPTWLVRDATITIVARALGAGSEEVAEALGRFAQPGSSDDTLECAGRCIAAARSRDGYVVPTALQPLERTLARHPSKVLRDLASDGSPLLNRALPAKYRLVLPAAPVTSVGSDLVFPAPYKEQYEMLANGLGLDLNTLLRVAARYASEALARLPAQEAVRRALESSHTKHAYPHQELAASRAAFGRVLADLVDAGGLDDAPPEVHRLLRTVDIELVCRTPRGRPNVVPAPPSAGLDQTTAGWYAGIESRLEEHVATSTDHERVVIGAKSQLTVLNWGHLEEGLVCGTTVGTARPVDDGIFARRHSMILRDLATSSASGWPENGEPLVVENVGLTFHQIHANWLAFRPDLAAMLAWTPDPIRPGRWHTAAGGLAVETIWWVDGWWGRAGPAFDDTEADGHAVLLTSRGLVDVAGIFGETTRHFVLTRRGREDGVEGEAVSATRSLPVVGPLCETGAAKT